MSTDPVAERTVLSIGEVLDLLKEEFPDVTISKIRFLESQGLVNPERTPSGYRKFYTDDVERLRWILRQQRENFLPLKVIKGRLLSGEQVEAPTGEEEPALAPPETPPPTGSERESAGAAESEAEAGPEAAGPEADGPLDHPLPADSRFTVQELAKTTGLDSRQVADLEKFGLLAPHTVAGQTHYDAHDLAVARLAAAFARHGITARHLRMYKTAADREASFYEQVVTPLVKQRNPQSRRQAVENLAELARLGEGLRGALLRSALREHTEGG